MRQCINIYIYIYIYICIIYIYIYIHILYSSVNIKNMFERRSTFFIITIITGDEGRRRRSET